MPRVIGEENYSEGETPMKLKAPLFSMLLLFGVLGSGPDRLFLFSFFSSSFFLSFLSFFLSFSLRPHQQQRRRHLALRRKRQECLRQLRGIPEQGSPGAGTPEQNAAPPTTASPDSTNPGATSSTTPTAAPAGSGNAITGCLAGSPIAGNYMLTDKSGNTYQLSGNLNRRSYVDRK